MITIESLAKAACNAETRSATQGEFVALYGVKQAAAKAWRDRVEVLAHNGKGKVFGGIWDSDKSFSLPGGGIEASEDAAKAALRELKEEAGLQGKNPVVLPIEPVQEKWTDKQRKESGRDFAGSRTRFVAVEVAKKLPKVKLDKWDAKDKGYYTWQEALESMKQKKFFSPVIAKSRIEALEHMAKTAMAAWRRPENLIKFVKQLESTTGKSIADSTGGYNRHNVLQLLSDKLNRGRQIGAGYAPVFDKLKWQQLPKTFRKQLDATDESLQDPKYLFRAINPGKNMKQPTHFDNAGLPADYVHASPTLDVPLRGLGDSQGYGQHFRGTRIQPIQMFKPKPGQQYFSDYQAHSVNATPGTTWDQAKQEILNQYKPTDLANPGSATRNNMLESGVWRRMYETRIEPGSNQFLGNFLIKDPYRTPTNRLAWNRQKMFDKLQYAKVPKNMTDKLSRMGVEQNKQLPVGGVTPVPQNPHLQPLEAQLTKASALQDEVKLQEHQQRIIDRMNEGDKRLLLYHGLGSGKSLSSLAAAEAAGGSYGAVTPASLRQNYEKEIEKFTTGTEPDVLSYSGIGAGKDFKQPVDTTIFDEAHRLRNPGTAAAQAAKRLAQRSKNLLLLTGTPITNHPSDLASLLGLLHNKNITPEQFEKDYVGYKKVYPTFLSRFTGKGVGEQPYVKNEAKLRQLLKGKIDYQPSKTPEGVNVKEEVVKVPLSTDQQRIQKAIKSGIPPEWSWKLNKEFPLTRDELKSLNSFLTGLRQSSLSTLPFRGDKKPITAFDESGKLQQALKDLKSELASDPRKKAITYSNYIDAGLSPYAAALEREKIPYGVFHGGIPLKQRKKTLQDYNEGKLRALLLGPAAAEGISTKGTNLIQLLDPHWHESRSSQARGRGLRFDSHAGLPEDLKNVAVKRYISESKEPSWLGKLFGAQRQRTGDEILQTLSADKEKLNDVFRKILQEEGTPVKAAEERSAVIIRGNPKFITGNPKADAFYAKLQKYLEQKGYKVQQDAGEPYTTPPKANVWLGHSRGVDRLRFAPEGTASVALGAPGGINHPKDKKMAPGDTPTSSHYLLTKKMLQALDSKLMEGTPVKAASDSVAYTLQNLVFSCIGLALQFKHCHWNVRGPMFKPLHDFLDEVHETLESTSDDLAERLVALDHPADGNPSGIASGFDHEKLPLKFMQPASIVDSLTDRLKSLCDEFNVAIKKTSSDPVTSNMLQDMTHKLEKHLWMLRSQKENADTAEKEAAAKALRSIMGR